MRQAFDRARSNRALARRERNRRWERFVGSEAHEKDEVRSREEEVNSSAIPINGQQFLPYKCDRLWTTCAESN